MITCKLNLRVYDSLLVLLDAVRLYRVYRRLDTLPLYLYYELLVMFIILLCIIVAERESQIFSFVAERDREQCTATSSLKFHRLI